jgi:hypothetical protein
MFGGLVASIPLVSVLAIVWLYADTHDTFKVAAFANIIFWLILPTLSLFLMLPIMLNYGMNFWVSLFLSLIIMTICDFITQFLSGYAGAYFPEN